MTLEYECLSGQGNGRIYGGGARDCSCRQLDTII